MRISRAWLTTSGARRLSRHSAPMSQLASAIGLQRHRHWSMRPGPAGETRRVPPSDCCTTWANSCANNARPDPRLRRKATLAEHHIGTDGVGMGRDIARRRGRLRVIVDTHPTEVVAEARFEEGALYGLAGAGPGHQGYARHWPERRRRARCRARRRITGGAAVPEAVSPSARFITALRPGPRPAPADRRFYR